VNDGENPWVKDGENPQFGKLLIAEVFSPDRILADQSSDRLAWGKIGYSLAVNGRAYLYALSTSAKS
jgi:hypothetical protein